MKLPEIKRKIFKKKIKQRDLILIIETAKKERRALEAHEHDKRKYYDGRIDVCEELMKFLEN